MSTARATILSAISEALRPRRTAKTDPAMISAEATALLTRVPPTRPDRVSGALEATFLARLAQPAIGGSGERIATLAEFPDSVRRYLAANGLPSALALPPDPALAALDWSGVTARDHIATDELVAVGHAFGGIAETASVVFHSSPISPTLFAFLPMHLIVALPADRLWGWLEDYASVAARTPTPRNVNLVTGPSATTDIEGTLVRGAHGPGHLHVVIYGPPSPRSAKD